MPKESDYFKPLRQSAVGIGGIGVTTGVVGSMVSQSGYTGTGLTYGLRTIAGFTPIASTAIGGKTVLKVLKKK